MSTRIEWTDETWNPLIGCSRISPGCDHCYAVGVVHRQMSPQHVGLTVKPDRAPTDWTGEVREVPHVLDKPRSWRKSRKVFVNSLSDLFHPNVSDDYIARVFAVMAETPQHTYQVLTKRPQRMRSWTEAHQPDPLPNVWLGTSIESDRYSWRAKHLRETPAALRWISAEPLLGPLPSLALGAIDWLVVGGESGPGARPMHPEWVRELRDRCLSPGITRTVESRHGAARATTVDRGPAFFFKQWGDWAPGVPDQYGRSGASKTPTVTQQGVLLDRDGQARDRNELTSFRLPADWCQMARVGKKVAGRELDGRTWDEYPA